MTMTFDIQRTAAATNTSAVRVHAAPGSNISHPVAHDMPVSIPIDELYYWTEAWQVGENATRSAFARGEGQTFATARDAIRYLLAND